MGRNDGDRIDRSVRGWHQRGLAKTPFVSFAHLTGIIRRACLLLMCLTSLAGLSVPAAFAQLPDLTVRINSITPDPATAGATISINYTLSNVGSAYVTVATGTKFYLSANSTLETATDTYLSPSVGESSSIAPGASITKSIPKTVSSGTAAGTWYIIAQADAFNALPESNETNNVASRSFNVDGGVGPPGPFALLSPTNGESLSPRTEATLAWGQSGGATSYDVYFGTSSSPPLIGNQTTRTRTVPVENGRTYYWKVIAKNSYGTITATGTMPWRFSVQDCPLSAPTLLTPSNGSTITFGTTTQRLSWSPASGATSYEVYFGTASSPPLYRNTTGSYIDVPVTAGTSYRWNVSSKNACRTASSTNGPFSFQVAEPGPDLTVRINSITPDPAKAGNSIAINYTLCNVGGSYVTVGTGTKFYLSANSTLETATDTNLSPSVGESASMAPGVCSTGSVVRILPVGTADGTWYIIAQADAFNALAESNETNNIGSRAFTVVSPPCAFSLLSPPDSASLPGTTTSVTLAWEAACRAASYDVYVGTSTPPPLAGNQTTVSRTVPVTRGNRYCWKVAAKNSAGETSAPPSGYWCFSVQGPPVVTSFAINGGAAETTSTSVTLSITATNSPTEYMASESSSFTGATWKPYSTGPSFLLTTALGTKRVYLKVRNAAGESAAVWDDIVLKAPLTPTGFSSFTVPPRGVVDTPILLEAKLWAGTTSTPLVGARVTFEIEFPRGSGTFELIDATATTVCPPACGPTDITTTSRTTDSTGTARQYLLLHGLEPDVAHQVRVSFAGSTTHASVSAIGFFLVRSANAFIEGEAYTINGESVPWILKDVSGAKRTTLRADRSSNKIPLILLHGDGGEEADVWLPHNRWAQLLDYIVSHPTDFAAFEVYLWVHDTSKPVGFNGTTGNAAELADCVNRFIRPHHASSTIMLMAHSRGGLVARSFMTRADATPYMGLITLATPHHGSPLAVHDWTALTFDSLLLVPPAEWYNRIAPDIDRLGSLNLGWDNEDNAVAATYSYDYDTSFSVPGWEELRVGDTNRLASSSTAVDRTVLYSGLYKRTFGALADLSRRTGLGIWSKVFAVGAYDQSPLTFAFEDLISCPFNEWTKGFFDHGCLSVMTPLHRLVAEAVDPTRSRASYIANDGMVSLQSALALDMGEGGVFGSLPGVVWLDLAKIRRAASRTGLLGFYILTAGGYWETTGDLRPTSAIVRDHLHLLDGGSAYWGLITRALKDNFLGPTSVSLSISPAGGVVTGCKRATGKITLASPAPAAGLTFTVTDLLDAATPPATVTVPPGATAKSFSIPTSAVSSTQIGSVTITSGILRATDTLTIRPMSVGTLTLTPSVVVGPATVAGAVTLECPAEPGDITVQLTSSQSTVAQPTVPSITIPRGASGGSFTVLALDVPAESSAVIGAEANRRKKTKKLIVQ